MKKRTLFTLLIISSILFSACHKNDKPSEVVDDTNKVHLIVLAGQSGARGKALVNDLDSEYKDINEDVDIYADGLTMDKLNNIPKTISSSLIINQLKPGYGDYPSEFGPELGIGKTLASRYPKLDADYKTVIVKYTASGSTFVNHWYSSSALKDNNISNKLDLSQVATDKNNNQTGPLTNNLYQLVDSAINMLMEYGYTPVIDGLAFIHGEQDAKFAINMDIYQKSLEFFIEDFRSYFNNEKLPVVITEALTNSATYSNNLRKIQSDVALSLDNVDLIKTNDLYTNRFEPWHFDADSNNILGGRIAANIISYNDDRVIKDVAEETIKVPHGVSIELPKYLKVNFTNYYQGYVKVNEYLSSYNPSLLGEQKVRFNAKTNNQLSEHELTINVIDNISYVDGLLNDYQNITSKQLANNKGNIYLKKGVDGVFIAASINDNEIYTDGENWHKGDMGQKDNNDDLRIYLTTNNLTHRKTICLSSANLLRVYKNGVSLSSDDITLESNNQVYQKEIKDSEYHVTTKGLMNSQSSEGMTMELYLSYKDLGVTNPSDIKLMFNYNDVTKSGDNKVNNDNYLVKTTESGGLNYEDNIDCYFSIDELL